MNSQKLKVSWTRFGIRTLLLVLLGSAVVFSWVAWKLDQRRKEQSTANWIKDMNGQVIFYAADKLDNRNWWKKADDFLFGETVRLAEIRNAGNCDLTPLKDLRNLQCLALSNSEVSDLAPLSGLHNLEEIYLEGTRVVDLTPLSDLRNLEMLWLDETNVNDLTPLSSVRRLKWLKLRNTVVTKEQVDELRKRLPDCEIVHAIRKHY